MLETINDPYLGIIKYDRDRERYEGKISKQNNEIIEFSFDIDDNLQEVLKATCKIIKSFDNFFLNINSMQQTSY